MPATGKWSRTVKDVAETLRTAKARDKGCALLIGAGCSVTAGIPAAAGIVARIREQYGLDYERATQKNYAGCMAAISAGERRDLIVNFVDAAKVNWAHVCIAQLMKEGYVDRILTTNFDPLVVRACALVGHFPAVYDFAASQLFDREKMPQHAVVYMHGQRSGFVLLNTKEEVEMHSELLKPVFDEAGQGRVWIVAGYSGDNDPVFHRLVEFDQFDNRLYWVGYGDAEPAQHVSESLLDTNKDAYYVSGMDSDAFFFQLASELKVFPPAFIGAPFSYLDGLMETLVASDVVQPGRKSSRDYMERARRMIREAVEQYERTEEAEAGRVAEDVLITGKPEELEKLASAELPPDAEMASQMAWAHVSEGNRLGDEALTASGDEADSLYRAAYKKYEAALSLQPEMHDALNNWGLTLADQASSKPADEADKLFREASAKFAAAVALAPRDASKLGNWAGSLTSHARMTSGVDSAALLAEAYEKYDRALELVPDDADTLNNIGIVLADQAKAAFGDEATRLFAKAYEAFERAVALAPETARNLSNWGLTLGDEAQRKAGAEADKLFAAAYEKHEAAYALSPEDAVVVSSWASTLSDHAPMKDGDAAARLYELAFQKYDAAYALAKNDNSLLINAGVMLLGQATWERGEKAAKLFTEATRRLRIAERVDPGSAAYNLACIAAIQGKRRDAQRWLEKSKKLGTLPSEEELRSDPDLDSIRDAEWFARLYTD